MVLVMTWSFRSSERLDRSGPLASILLEQKFSRARRRALHYIYQPSYSIYFYHDVNGFVEGRHISKEWADPVLATSVGSALFRRSVLIPSVILMKHNVIAMIWTGSCGVASRCWYAVK